MFALASTTLFAAAGAALEYSSLTARRAELQSAADSAALGAARELSVAYGSDERTVAVAKSIATSRIEKSSRAGTRTGIEAQVLNERSTVQVGIQEDIPNTFGKFLYPDLVHVSVAAKATLVGGMPICVLVLDTSSSGALAVNQSGRLTAQGCLVQSNSKDASGLKLSIGGTARLTSGRTCSSGGAVGSVYAPAAVTDCPVLTDPLASRPAPKIGACSNVPTLVDGRKTPAATLSPGVYCGGLKVTNGAVVTLMPGTYIIKNGPLTVNNGATFRGEYVGFYLTGATANFQFTYDTTVSLSAPKDGDMAGLLFFRDRIPGNPNDQNLMMSNNARRLLGTIYMPASSLHVDAQAPVADQSEYTVLVVRKLQLFSGPNLVLNKNYGGTDVPVPAGVGPVGRTPILSQ